MTVLELDRFTYRYPGVEEPALDAVSLVVAEGELAVVAGRSGSGKSTLLRAACGLVPHFHGGSASGTLRVGGLDVRRHGPGALAAVVGTLTQDPETQTVMTTVAAELAFGVENRGWPAPSVARAVEEVALALGIGELLERSVHELSGGELQRVALGAALAGRPRLLVLDEPTSQLDPVAGAELIGLLRRINEEWGTTVLVCEHRLERVLPSADRVIALDGGRVGADTSPAGFLAWAQVEDPALLPPAARLLDLAGIAPLAAGVKAARAALRAAGCTPWESAPALPDEQAPSSSWLRRRRSAPGEPALELRGVWQEWPGGRTALRDASLRLEPGELVALMGRNGAGKSTLMRIAAGLLAPSRGRVLASGRVALLLQHPGDYLIHDRVADEAGAGALAAQGLAGLGDRHPRDLSGGERQRLALAAVVDAGPGPPAVLLLDEPTRGMDRERAAELADGLRALAAGGVAVLVATHDPEFAAAWAHRVVLMGAGRALADGPVSAVLAGGLYFATETARVLGGAGGVLRPAQGAALLAEPGSAGVPDATVEVRSLEPAP